MNSARRPSGAVNQGSPKSVSPAALRARSMRLSTVIRAEDRVLITKPPRQNPSKSGNVRMAAVGVRLNRHAAYQALLRPQVALSRNRGNSMNAKPGDWSYNLD